MKTERLLNVFSVFEILKVNLSRPFILSFTEPILWFWNAYVGVSPFNTSNPTSSKSADSRLRNPRIRTRKTVFADLSHR